MGNRVKDVLLQWYQYDVADLYEAFKKSVLVLEPGHLPLSNYGFYVYFDQNLALPPKYIGQFFGRSPRTLAKRIRWEVVKDGSDGGAVSRFSQKCQEHAVNKPSLILKVGNIKEPNDPSKHDPQLMNDIEMALIHEMQPVMNDHGKRRYRRGSIEIMNTGDFVPLPLLIRK